MPTYIRLVKFTEQGVRNVRTVGDQMAEARKIVEANGGKLVHSWSTLGRYDLIAVVEAPDNKTMMKISALVAEKVNIRAETLPAVPSPEFAESVKKQSSSGFQGLVEPALQHIDPLRELEVSSGEAAGVVRREGELHPVPRIPDVGMVVRSLRELRDAIQERHRLLEISELPGPLDRLSDAGPLRDLREPLRDFFFHQQRH